MTAVTRTPRARARRRIGSGRLRALVATVALGAAALVSGPGGQAHAATLPALVPVADAYVQSDRPSTNFGTAATLNNVSGTPEARAYLKFDLTGVTGVITKVTFRAFTSTSSGSGYELHRVADTGWTETGLTYANRPAVGSTVGSAVNITANTWTSVDVTSAVTGPGVYSFEMNATSTNLKRYASRESGANAPQLVVQTASASGTPAALNTLAGTTPQSATVNTAFATRLAVKVTDSGGLPVAGAGVTFQAPASGAGGTFGGTGGTVAVASGTDGVATAPAFTANGATGTYQVTASVAGLSGRAAFSLTNTAAGGSGVVTVLAGDDGYVAQDQPTSNFGTSAVLKNVTSPDTRAYLKFTVAGLTGAITKATFRAYTLTSSGSGYELHRVADNGWTGGGLTYATRPAVGATIGTATNMTANTWTSVDVTPYVTGNGTYSLEMNATSTNVKQYSSREGANPPQLVLQVGAPAGTASALAAVAGDRQSAGVGTSFATNLAVKATDAGGKPVPGTVVTFTAPTGGAGGAFPSGATATATADGSGVATAPVLTANATAGSYQVTAAAAGVAAPATFTLTNAPSTAPAASIVADAYVRADQPAANFGTGSLLIGGSSPEIDSYLTFNVANLSGQPGKATLRLYSQTTGTTALKVYQVTDTGWAETGITFGTKPAFGGLVATSGPTTSGTWLELDVTGAVTRNGTVSFGFTSGTTVGKNFSSREDAAHAPQLVLQAPPPAAGDPVVGAVGDIACDPVDPNWNNNLGQNGYCHHKATSDLALASNPQWMLTLGDTQYNGGTASQFAASYDPTWGRLKAITRPALGNHEFGTSGAGGYFTYFGDAATPLQPGCRRDCNGWYSFDVGTWHVVALNSECDRNSGNCLAGSQQETWLRNDLQTHHNTCTLVYTHHPKWSSSSFADVNMDPLIQDMYDNGVDLMLVGHAHQYERFAPQNPAGQRDDARGITEIVVGTGGRDFGGFLPIQANSVVHNNNTYGIVKLTLHPASADFQFLRDTTSTGFLADSGTATCH